MGMSPDSPLALHSITTLVPRTTGAGWSTDTLGRTAGREVRHSEVRRPNFCDCYKVIYSSTLLSMISAWHFDHYGYLVMCRQQTAITYILAQSTAGIIGNLTLVGTKLVSCYIGED